MSRLVPLVGLSLFASCISTPTHAQIDGAGIGPKPTMVEAQNVAKELIRPKLKNPDSAIFSFTDSLERGYYNPKSDSVSAPAAYGWTLGCTVISKDSYGSLSAQTPWKVFFRESAEVATSLLVDYRGLNAVEVVHPPRPVQ